MITIRSAHTREEISKSHTRRCREDRRRREEKMSNEQMQ